MATPHNVAFVLAILVCSSTASLRQEVMLPVPQHLERSGSSTYAGFLIEIEGLPWHAIAQCGDQVCSGAIIHKDWILVLKTCACNYANESDIRVFAGGANPQNATQVTVAEIHETANPLEGVTLLHLKNSLAFSEKVQPSRIPRSDLGNFNYLYGLASGFAPEGNTIHLKAFDTTLFTDLCPDSEDLCALGLDWPQSELAGTDFLGLFDYFDGGRDTYYNCFVGVRKAQLENNFTSFYPLLSIVPSIERELGLKVKPTPPAADPNEQALCGILN